MIDKHEKDIEKILRFILPSLNKGLASALAEIIHKWKFFVSFNDLSRMILLTLEEKMRLSSEVKEKLAKELERIYKEEVAGLPANILRIPGRTKDEIINFIRPDTQTIRYAVGLHDFYLGKFFQGDREIRLRAIKWMSKYYLEQGNPIGKGQKGVKEFLDAFGDYLKTQTEWKARQIIDTSVNYLRNSARLKAFKRANIKYYRWDATNDRLTCPACRSLDGRVFKTEEAVRILETIEASEDPKMLKELRPIITTPWTGKTKSLPTKYPPLHPHCYDEDTEVYTSEGWKYFRDLRGDEKIFSLNPKTLEPEWLPILKIIKWYHKGKLLHFYHRHFNLMVTAQHSMLLYFRHKNKGRKPGFYFETAQWCEEHKWDYYFYRSLEWKGNLPEKITFGGIDFEPAYFVKLMGYYLAEGSTSINSEGRFVIKIAQSNQEKLERIYQDLVNGPLKIWKGKEAVYIKATSKELGKVFQKLGKAHEKRVPDCIKQLPSEYIRTFLLCYAFGDGTTKKGNLFTASKKLCDDLGELILKAGWHPSFYLQKVKGKKCNFKNGVYTINHDIWRITIKYSKFASRQNIKVSKVDYEGYVYCVELPKNHTLWVRRKGQTVWSGNCRCRIVAEEEEVTLPVMVERPSFAKDTPAQRELEEFYGNLSRKELENRIKAHLGADWNRPVKGEKGVKAYKRARNNAYSHFKKHKEEFGFTSKEEYFKSAYEVIRNPDRVYVEKSDNTTNFIFIKGNRVVISNDDNLAIKSYFKLLKEAEKDIEFKLKGEKRDGLIRIL